MELNRRFRIISFALILLTGLAGCASTKPQMSTMELRSMQTKEYDNVEKLEVYNAVVNALLDREFVIKSSDSNSGVLLANYTTTQLNSAEVVTKAITTYFTFGLNWIFGDNNLDDTLIVDISCNVTKIGNVSRVRLNAVAKRKNSDGEIVMSKMIVEPEYYDGIFQQVEKSVFLEENLD